MQEPVLSSDRHAETGVPVAAARHGPDFRVPRWLVWVTYAPLLAWGPLLGVATLAYWLRRRRQPCTTAATSLP